ncbi:TIP41-like family-domain-containing protein [Melampsora americana]|nr:TIP41-like family-domain-containing protein [Melampsora americana]
MSCAITKMPESQLTSTDPVNPEAGKTGIRKFEIDGWCIETCKLPILNSKQSKTFTDRLTIPLPEICFGQNRLEIHHLASGFKYNFNTLSALLLVDPTEGSEGEHLKVAYADHWSSSRKPTETVTKVVNPFDWTYTTNYIGTDESVKNVFERPNDVENHPGIPLAVLSRPDPILFFDEVTLFEDELHDNGMASLQVKVRVMPSCIFVLSRFFLRVDGVIFRVFDVRLFIDIKKNQIIREVKGKEMSYNEVKNKLPIEKPHDLTPLTDPNWVGHVMGMIKKDQNLLPPPLSSSISSERKPWKSFLGTHLEVAILQS